MCEQSTKTCTKCGQTKPLTDYYRESKARDGHRAHCKACAAAWRREYSQAHAVEIRLQHREYRATPAGQASKRRYYEKNKEQAVGNSVRWQERNREKCRAQYAVHNAIKDGKLQRQPCEVCGDPKSEAHHDSYEREDRLNIRWLCRKHHRELSRLP